MRQLTTLKGGLLATTAVAALIAASVPVDAGGFSIREQSASSQGASFAGNAANNDLSAMFWNPAAAANKSGFNTESHFSVIVPRGEITATSASHPVNAGLNATLNAAGNSSGNIGSIAVLGASYMSYQFRNYDPNLFLALAINSPFGLKTDLDKAHENYKGSVVGRESKLLTMNINPTLAYRLSPNLSVGVGVQFQYGNGRFSFATGAPFGPDSRFDGTGVAIGGTAGIMWSPTKSTTVGLGFRSQLSQKLEGAYMNAAGAPNPVGFQSVDAKTTLELPNMVTLSVRQEVASNARVMGTVEWAQWSRFKELRLVGDGNSPLALVPNAATGSAVPGVAPGTVIGVLPANWSDSWFFALGGEYDVSRQLTVRVGGAYEISPIDSAKKRLIGIPDNDRIWASLGASYKWSESMTFDIAYTHLFVKDSQVDRESLTGVRFLGNVEASTDIVSVSMKTKW
jgi:long-chain fatty acid transport protein